MEVSKLPLILLDLEDSKLPIIRCDLVTASPGIPDACDPIVQF